MSSPDSSATSRSTWRPLAAIPILLALALALAMAMAGCSGENASTHERRASELLAEGRVQAALLELRTAVQLEPDDARLQLRVAEVLRDHDRRDEAVDFYRDAHYLEPEDNETALRLAELLVESDAKASAKLVGQVLKRDPNNPHAFLVRSKSARRAGDMPQAESWLTRARALVPEDPEIDWQEGRLREAKIQQIRGQSGAQRLQSPRTFEAAIGAYQRYVEHGGRRKLKALRLRAGLLALWPGHREQAAHAYREAYERALAEGDRWQQLQALEEARAYGQRSGSRALERSALETIVELENDNLLAWQWLASLTRRSGADAKPIYERMLESQRANPRAHVLFARLLAAKNLTDAVGYLRAQAGGASAADAAILLAGIAGLQFDANHPKDALQTVAELERLYPKDPATHLMRGRAQIERGDLRVAVETLRALVREAETPDAQRTLARTEHQLGHESEALEALDRAIELSRGTDEKALRLRAQILFADHQYQKAIASLKQLQVAFGLRGPEQVILASCYYEVRRGVIGQKMLLDILSGPRPAVKAALEFAKREGKHTFYRERARAYLEKAYASEPKTIELLQTLTRFDLDDGQGTRAMIRLHKAVGRSSRWGALYLLRARTEIELGDIRAARDDAERALALDPLAHEEAVELLALLLARVKDPRAIVASLEKRDRAKPLSPDRRVLLARLYLKTGEEGKALRAYERALADGSDLILLKNDLAFLLAERGEDLARAESLAEEAKDAPGEQIAATDTLGYVYLKQGNYEAAQWQFRYALEHSNPVPAQLYYHLGLALRGLGRTREAARAFDQALGVEPGFPAAAEARRNLGALGDTPEQTPADSTTTHPSNAPQLQPSPS